MPTSHNETAQRRVSRLRARIIELAVVARDTLNLAIIDADAMLASLERLNVAASAAMVDFCNSAFTEDDERAMRLMHCRFDDQWSDSVGTISLWVNNLVMWSHEQRECVVLLGVHCTEDVLYATDQLHSVLCEAKRLRKPLDAIFSHHCSSLFEYMQVHAKNRPAVQINRIPHPAGM